MGDDDVEEEDRSQDLGPHFARACAVEMHINMSQKPLYTGIYRKKCRSPEPRRRLCAGLRSRNAHQHVTRAALLHGNLQGKKAFPRTAAQISCEPQTHVKVSPEPLCTEICRKNAAAQNHGPHFAPACAVETHVKISQEPLYAEIYRKNA